jgi:hypothetical protein
MPQIANRPPQSEKDEKETMIQNYRLSDLVGMFEDKARKAEQELYEVRSTLIVNFIKQRGNIPQLIDENDLNSDTISLLIKIMQFLIKHYRETQGQNVSDILTAWEQFKKANWFENDSIDVEKKLMYEFSASYNR